MTTKVSGAKVQPAITMDKLHIESLTFHQSRVNDPKRVIGASGCLYGFDANGDKVFDNETIGVSDKDLDKTVILAAIASGKTVEEFGLEYATAKAQIDAAIKNGTITDAELMAYFEAALGRIFELHGKVKVSGVE